MSVRLFLTFTLAIIVSCSANDNNQSYNLEVEDIGNLAINKTVKYVIDSLGLKTDEMSFIQEPQGILKGIRLNYNEGVLAFFFHRISVTDQTRKNKQMHLDAISEKIIDKVEWEAGDGRRGSVHSIKIY